MSEFETAHFYQLYNNHPTKQSEQIADKCAKAIHSRFFKEAKVCFVFYDAVCSLMNKL
jgi:hypothetical protein